MVQSDGHRLILSERSGGSLDVTLTRPASRDQIGNLPSSDGVLKVIHLTRSSVASFVRPGRVALRADTRQDRRPRRVA